MKLKAKEMTLPPPDIGNSWGYPQTIPEDWVAQTDLSVYRISTDNWQTAQSIAPILSPDTEDANHSGNGHIPSAAKKKAVLPVQKTRKVTPSQSPEAAPQDQSEVAVVRGRRLNIWNQFLTMRLPGFKSVRINLFISRE